MNTESDFFIAAWKDMADIDDFLAGQVDKAVRRIRDRFERKQEECECPADVIDFRLGVVVKKRLVAGDNAAETPYVWIELGLLGPPTLKSGNRYRKVAILLRAALQEVATMTPSLERVQVTFRWSENYSRAISRK